MAKILLVEDDNNLREIYEARLQAEGYDIVSASDGEEALVVAKKERPDLVISDVMMPKISGFEMLDILRNTDGLKDVQVIMLTALGQAEDRTRADQLGADKYLVKSQVTLEDIVKTAHQLLDDEPAAPAATEADDEAAPAAAAPEPAPVQPAPQPVAPAPAEPVAAAPAPEPAASQAAPVAAPPADDTSAAATTAAETAAMEAQIESFVSTPTPQTAAAEPASAEPAPAAATPAAPPAELVAPATEPAASATSPSNQPAPADDQSSNDQVMNDALASLNTTGSEPGKPSDVTAVEVPPEPAPAAASEPELATTPAKPDSTTAGGKKVIQPLNDVDSKKDLSDLLAKEAASEPVAMPDANAVVTPPPEPPTPPAGQTPPATPPQQPPTGPDPNSIAL
ncbi:MAG TPA: response regulator [Candidatus Saccharimonadales bacterium]|nr:response regulator [Candidatus Saccharimonadales bacterium]